LAHQIAFTLPHAPDRLVAVALSRREHDFSDRERDLLARARPYLIQAYRNAVEYARVCDELQRALRKHEADLVVRETKLSDGLARRGVTHREIEVLSCIATGASDRAAAEMLGLSERTVQKHLQRCFAKLGVHTRAEAVARAWALAGQDAAGPEDLPLPPSA
jgi:ATP/maltotriose-dependent transcriptional regulator MalT